MNSLETARRVEMQSQGTHLAQALVAVATGDNSIGPTGSLPLGVEAGGSDVLGAGRLGAEGHQLVLRTASGHCVIKSYLHDAVAPLIISRAGTFDADLSVTSCCMTDVDCGGGLKCTSAEDPCPGGKVTDPWLGDQVGPLLGSEVRLIEALAEQVGRLAIQPAVDPASVEKEVATLRSAHEHRQLLFAAEPDGPGWWYDWILRLSNGMSLHVTLATNPTRSAPIFRVDEFGPHAIERSTRISVIATDTGEHLLLPRMFIGG
jgi:hypothetical protein